MKSLQQKLREYEQKLRELTNPAHSEEMTPEVRQILMDTCVEAIAQLKQEIQEDAA